MNIALSPLVIVDHAACERLGSAIRSMDIPEDREESPPAALSPAQLGDFYLLLVTICHQTQSLRGTVGGQGLRGWDYLHGRLAEAVERDQGLLDASRWTEFGADDVSSLFVDPEAGQTLSDLEGRAALIRDLGSFMGRLGWSSFDVILEAAGRRIATGSPSLLELLARFRAFIDPVRKKSTFLLGLIRNEARVEFADPWELVPPVDYHEVRGHLRIGTVAILEPELRKKLLDRVEVTAGEDIAIRSAVLEAIRYIPGLPALPDPMRLHYPSGTSFAASTSGRYLSADPARGRPPSRLGIATSSMLPMAQGAARFPPTAPASTCRVATGSTCLRRTGIERGKSFGHRGRADSNRGQRAA